MDRLMHRAALEGGSKERMWKVASEPECPKEETMAAAWVFCPGRHPRIVLVTGQHFEGKADGMAGYFARLRSRMLFRRSGTEAGVSL